MSKHPLVSAILKSGRLPASAFASPSVLDVWAVEADLKPGARTSVQSFTANLAAAPPLPEDLPQEARKLILSKFGPTYGTAILAATQNDPELMVHAVESDKVTMRVAALMNPNLPTKYLVGHHHLVKEYTPREALLRPHRLRYLCSEFGTKAVAAKSSMWKKEGSLESRFAAEHPDVVVPWLKGGVNFVPPATLENLGRVLTITPHDVKSVMVLLQQLEVSDLELAEFLSGIEYDAMPAREVLARSEFRELPESRRRVVADWAWPKVAASGELQVFRLDRFIREELPFYDEPKYAAEALVLACKSRAPTTSALTYLPRHKNVAEVMRLAIPDLMKLENTKAARLIVCFEAVRRLSSEDDAETRRAGFLELATLPPAYSETLIRTVSPETISEAFSDVGGLGFLIEALPDDVADLFYGLNAAWRPVLRRRPSAELFFDSLRISNPEDRVWLTFQGAWPDYFKFLLDSNAKTNEVFDGLAEELKSADAGGDRSTAEAIADAITWDVVVAADDPNVELLDVEKLESFFDAGCSRSVAQERFYLRKVGWALVEKTPEMPASRVVEILETVGTNFSDRNINKDVMSTVASWILDNIDDDPKALDVVVSLLPRWTSRLEGLIAVASNSD